MENRIWNQKTRGDTNTKQNADTHRDRGDRGYTGERSSNLIRLIGAERVSRRDFKYEGTFYVTEDGELYDKKQMNVRKMRITSTGYYEVTGWKYDERKKMYQPIIRRIVPIKGSNTQLSLNL